MSSVKGDPARGTSAISGSPIWAITCFFGAGSRDLRYRQYRTFRASLRQQGVPLLCVELADGSQNYLLGAQDAEFLIQRRSNSILWQKERLFNLALHHLPSTCEKVCWLDCDIVFLNQNWVSETSALLEELQVLQLFETVFRAPEGYELSRYQAPDFDWNNVPFGYDLEEGCQLRSALAFQRTGIRGPWSPGYAWAARRELLDSIGLYEYCVVGGADQLIADAVVGSRMRADNLYYRLPNFTKTLAKYQQELTAAVAGAYGFTPGRIVHLFHGRWSSRQYDERGQILQRNAFNPETELKRINDVWQWNTDNVALIREIEEYFLRRNAEEMRLLSEPQKLTVEDR